ncbi:hypothetical protein DL770_007436 [Monosporascus sp. CRB-9-2]|nr:hypothetical protein DL770_007436 [Monosporascus sp. CRB-9-2]
MTESADRQLKAKTEEGEHRSEVNDSNKSIEADNADAEDNEEVHIRPAQRKTVKHHPTGGKHFKKGRKTIKSKPTAGVDSEIDTDDHVFAITASTPTGRNKKDLEIEDALKRAKFEYGHD